MKLSEASVKKHAPSPQKYIQTIFPNVVPMLLKSILEWHLYNLFESRFREIVRWGFLDSPLQYER